MIYEMRTYTLKPGKVAEFEERFAGRLPYRQRHFLWVLGGILNSGR
jgi:heme-degrading monooxygenase HmoA